MIAPLCGEVLGSLALGYGLPIASNSWTTKRAARTRSGSKRVLALALGVTCDALEATSC
jgi:hypothetical protein